MAKQTRRSFLEISALGLVATTVPDALGQKTDQSKPAAGNSPISIWVTADNQRYHAGPTIRWNESSGRATAAAGQIQLNPDKQFQDILGFGGAFTDAACYTFNRLEPGEREALFHELFHPSQMGLSMGRLCVGSSDYATKVYSFDEGDPDPEMKRFSIAHDSEYIIPILREARQVNPDLFLFSSPWSPPGWMKFNGSMLGGSMRKKYLASYAQYFLKFLQAYAAEGVPIQAVTSQNEVDTDQDGRMPACLWGQEYEIEFVKGHLGPVLREHGIPAKIWLLDHNYNLWGRVICELDDPDVRKYANAVAWHGYAGVPSMVSKVHDAHPDGEMHWTEGGPDYTSPDYATDWAKWGHTFTEALRNWCQSLTGWNLALDENGRPNIGPFPCGGLVTVHSQTKEITRSGQYWAFAHFSRLIRRGARRFDSQGILPDVDHVACENPDGQKVLVITNAAAARPAVLQMGMMTA